ncbi:MAG: hypothetical protein HYZ57_18605 [Acidobacteria bacterium]|nr:hypothetical protein [Acidobacteriota bacterium]
MRRKVPAPEIAVLPGEDPQVFAELRQAFYDEYQPAGPSETLCVEKLVLSMWRSRRVASAEVAAITGIGFGRVFLGSIDPLNRIARYEGALDRSFYRALKELRQLQSARDARAAFDATSIETTAHTLAPAANPLHSPGTPSAPHPAPGPAAPRTCTVSATNERPAEAPVSAPPAAASVKLASLGNHPGAAPAAAPQDAATEPTTTPHRYHNAA